METILVEEQEIGKRLDKLLADRFCRYSRTYFQYLIEKRLVLLNGQIVKKREQPSLGDEIEIQFALTEEISLEPENMDLDILYEDKDLLIINKPSGMVVHPGAGNPSHTFVNALLYHCRKENSLSGFRPNDVRPGIVHRLDKETTGLLLAAKNEHTQEKLVSLFSQREIEKEYIAICIGNPGHRTIHSQIGRHPIKRKQMAVVQEGGKEALTEVITLAYNDRFSVVKLRPKTGRTHQLRVHLQDIKMPILGDDTYGNEPLNRKCGALRPLLHARRLYFIHPITGQKIDISAPIPEDFKKYLELCNYSYNN